MYKSAANIKQIFEFLLEIQIKKLKNNQKKKKTKVGTKQ